MSSRYDKANIRKLRIFLLTITLTLIAIFLMRNYLVAVFLAIIFGILLDPMYQFFKRTFKGGRGLTATITFITFAVLVIIPSVIITGMIVDQTFALGEAVRPWVEKNISNAQGLSFQFPSWVPFSKTLNSDELSLFSRLPQFTTKIAEFAFNFINSLARGSMGAFLQLFIFSYALYFFLGRAAKVAQQLMNLLPFNSKERDEIISDGVTTARSILKSVLIVGTVQGVLIALALWVTGIDRPVFWGLIVAGLSAIPLFGSGLVWIPAAIYLAASGQPGAGIAMALWGFLVVGMVDNILRPKIVGSDANIPDLLVFLSILAGVSAFGFSGLLIGPVLIAIYLAVLRIYHRNLDDDILIDGDEAH